jgi:hypothetical protein
MAGKACTCKDCPTCGAKRMVCAACNRCTRCADHVPGCPGCPFREEDSINRFFRVKLYSEEDKRELLEASYVVAESSEEAAKLAGKAYEAWLGAQGIPTSYDSSEVEELNVFPTGVYYRGGIELPEEES